jgi:hypothetical protein
MEFSILICHEVESRRCVHTYVGAKIGGIVDRYVQFPIHFGRVSLYVIGFSLYNREDILWFANYIFTANCSRPPHLQTYSTYALFRYTDRKLSSVN